MGNVYLRAKAWLVALSCFAGVGWVVGCGSTETGILGDPGTFAPAAFDGAAGAPYLTALSVSVTGASPQVTRLVPTFSSEVHDYYVRCAEGTNALTVSMTASPGSSSLLLQPAPSGSLPQQILSLDVNENAAIVAAATDERGTTEYWVRCLPHDMPVLNWTAHPEIGTPSPGYYLVGNLFPPARTGGYALVLDGNGVPVWYARAPIPLGVSSVDSLVPGSVSFFPLTPSQNGSFEIRELSSLETSNVPPAADEANAHELRRLPNGNYLVFAYPTKSRVDLTGLHLPMSSAKSQALGPNSVIEDCAIQELTPTGTLVSTWLASDHFDPAKDSTYPTLDGARQADGGLIIDAFHCNSIDVDPANGNLLVSARNMDSIFYVDRATGAVLWKMGGSTYTKDQATYVAATEPFFRQHDARLQPGWSSTCYGGSGQVSVFDDETSTSSPARAVIYDVTVGAGDGGAPVQGGCEDGGAPEGGTAGVATVARLYRGSSNSNYAGSVRTSADGSFVVCWGASSMPVFTEVNAGGSDMLDFDYGDGEPSYRAVKVPLNTFDLGVLRSTAGLP
jgi:hypothetical protein